MFKRLQIRLCVATVGSDKSWSGMMKLVEESSGTGELTLNGVWLRPVQYRFSRFQGISEGSGLPIPGLHRIEGVVDFDAKTDPHEWIGVPLKLRLPDGRALGITLIDNNGRILSEGHGPAKCLCC
jgi:hypothetical protein